VEKFVGNVRAREKLLDMGVPVNASLLLHGEPGTGKSTMAAFIASKLGLPLVTARSDALISSYLGSTSKNIRSLLEYAGSEPCVLFLDEFDAIAKARDDKNEIGELKRVVVSLLQNIDSLGDTVLIAATNHPHLLDPAIWRRFHYKMELEKPSDKTREAMFLSLLKSVNLNKNDILQLVKFSQGLTGAEVEMAVHSYLRTIIIESHAFNVTGLIRELLSQRYHGIDFESEKRNESLIKLRNEDESLFSYRVLGTLFSMAESNARKIVKGNSND
jgi:SpoVK/Ycf46/Vps4 family AAA+-type ATPase